MNLANELENIFIGKKLGYGCYRDVYKHRLDDSLVIKVEREDDTFSNVMEWKIWEEIEHWKEAAQWFAPCVAISPSGKILIQKKVELGRRKDYPKQLPACFTDIKTDNFGFLGNKLVCFDYGSLRITKNFTIRLKNVNWF